MVRFNYSYPPYLLLIGLLASLGGVVKATEVNLNPSGLATGLGFSDINVMLPLNKQWHVGPSVGVATMHFDQQDIFALAYGLRAEQAFNNHQSNGFYSAWQLDYVDVTRTKANLSCQAPMMFSGKGAAGYAWRFANRLQLKSAAGLYSITFLGDTYDCDDGSQEVEAGLQGETMIGLALELSVGAQL